MKKIGLLLCFIFIIGTAFAQDALSYFDKGVEYVKANNPSQAISCFKKANELLGGNDSSCQFSIGLCYDFAKNYAQAVYWYRKAAELGDAQAQHNLGLIYANGRGVTKDDTQAVYWYRKAAEQGYGDAQGRLSICYYYGTGVAKDLEQTKYWARKSIAQESTSPQLKAFMKALLDQLSHQ